MTLFTNASKLPQDDFGVSSRRSDPQQGSNWLHCAVIASWLAGQTVNFGVAIRNPLTSGSELRPSNLP